MRNLLFTHLLQPGLRRPGRIRGPKDKPGSDMLSAHTAKVVDPWDVDEGRRGEIRGHGGVSLCVVYFYRGVVVVGK
jgi:hypothetical protein